MCQTNDHQDHQINIGGETSALAAMYATDDVVEVCGTPYRIDRLLGKGKGGYSYLCKDEDGCEVVVKQIHHEPCDYYTFGNKLASELSDYNRLKAIGIRMPAMLAADRNTERIVKEYIPGPTVYDLVLRNQLPEWCVEAIQDMCEILYPAGLNIDYFPTNFIPHEGMLYYVDYECNPYNFKWDFEHWGRKYWVKTSELLGIRTVT